MLKEIHKFASETSRPIAMKGTRKHTQIYNWGRSTKEWAQNVESTENARVAQLKRLARLLNRRIRHLCTTYKMQNVWAFDPKYAMCMMFPVFFSRWSKMIGYDNLMCNVVWCYGTFLQASLLFLFFLKALFFFYMATMRNAQTKIAIVYMREQSCDTRDDMMIPIWYGRYAMEGWIPNVHK